MSSAAARDFLPTLRKVETELPVPVPDRVRILRELEFDLEELRRQLLERGHSDEEARRQALEALRPDGAALDELRQLHAPVYVRLSGRLGVGRVTLIERTALTLTAAAVLLAESFVLLRADLLRDPSPFLWAVIVLGGLIVAAIVGRTFQLFIQRDHAATQRGLAGLLGLSVATVCVGFIGAFVDLYALAATLEQSPELAATLAPRWLVRDAALLSVSLLLSMTGGLTWFVLTQWLGGVADAHRRVLGLDSTKPT